MSKATESLLNYGAAVEPIEREREAFVVRFVYVDIAVTMRVLLQDYSGAHVVITNMTTLDSHVEGMPQPRDDRMGRGLGSDALQILLAWASQERFTDIRAVQIQEQSEGFWIKNGFVRLPEPNDCNDFQFRAPLHP